MQHEETLNTEENDIAGNRLGGPAGNTATQRTAPGAGVGQPGGPPTSLEPAPDKEAVSSEELAEAETSPGQGAVGQPGPPQENKEADPADLVPAGAYGGNFSNSTQDSYRDSDRRENQRSDANRGEFGVQDAGGTTHGGFGNQNRVADYDQANTPEDRYYGGPGAPGVQTNSYRTYDGRDERPDQRANYGFERGTNPATPAGPVAAAAPAAHQEDNGSVKGVGSGYAADYGRTSLPGTRAARPDAQPVPDHRNQTEDYMPMGSETDANGRHGVPTPDTTNTPQTADAFGQLPATGQGYGDQGRQQPNATPNMATGDARNGYATNKDNDGNVSKGIGSEGGSYNDQYDDSQPNSKAGSPAKGEERTEDRSQNYGQEARQENRASSEENAADHGAPQRNAGRE